MDTRSTLVGRRSECEALEQLLEGLALAATTDERAARIHVCDHGRLHRRRLSLAAQQRAGKAVARADAELGEHLAQMPFDRSWAEVEQRGNLGVGEPVTRE